MTIRFSADANTDLAEYQEFIAKDNPAAASRASERVVAIIRSFVDARVHGRQITLTDGRRVRAWSIPPFRVYYRERGSVTEIVRVYHHARRPIEKR